MSQQSMSSNNSRPEEIRTQAGDYHGNSIYGGYSGDMAGQKLSTKTPLLSSPASPSSGHRLALAVVSLLLWFIAFYVVVQVIGSVPSAVTIVPPHGGGTPYSQDNANWQHYLTQIFFAALVVFGALILSINLIFNFAYKRRH